MDAISLQRIQLLHPKLRAEATLILKEIEEALTGRAMCRFTFTLRSFAEQAALYKLGRTVVNPDGRSTKKPLGNIVTNAPAGSSLHNFGLAVDIALVLDTNKDGKFDTASWDTNGDYDNDKHSDWMEVVAIFKKHGWIWGADWNNNGKTKAQGDTKESFVDYPHFQKTFGLTSKQCLNLHNTKRVDAHGYILI